MKRELTGKHVLAIFAAAFGTIIAVNLTLAYFAVASFPGVEVRNSYIASQNFDRQRNAQENLGWTVTPALEGGVLSVQIADAQGLPAQVDDLAVTLGRPSHDREDIHPQMQKRGGVWVGAADAPAGVWVLHLRATAPDGTEFRQRIDRFAGNIVR